MRFGYIPIQMNRTSVSFVNLGLLFVEFLSKSNRASPSFSYKNPGGGEVK